MPVYFDFTVSLQGPRRDGRAIRRSTSRARQRMNADSPRGAWRCWGIGGAATCTGRHRRLCMSSQRVQNLAVFYTYRGDLGRRASRIGILGDSTSRPGKCSRHDSPLGRTKSRDRKLKVLQRACSRSNPIQSSGSDGISSSSAFSARKTYPLYVRFSTTAPRLKRSGRCRFRLPNVDLGPSRHHRCRRMDTYPFGPG